MPRSDEAEWWFSAVYEAVQEIPYGRVTSYGHIARLLGRRKFGCAFYEEYTPKLIVITSFLQRNVLGVPKGI